MSRYAEARTFCSMLTEAGFPTMMAGGCVRDRLFGKEPKDFDLATTGLPEDAMRFFKNKGYRVIPTGLKHGTISVVTKLQTVEVTTLRTDLDCDGRHADVAFSTDFREDALRRDFTINALFEDYDGQVHDHVGGLADLENRTLRFVGQAEERIREDYLRILRYFRFLGRYGWSPLPDQLEAITANLDGLTKLSIERVQSEMNQILASPHVGQSLPMLTNCGLIAILFPFLNTETFTPLIKLLQDMRPASLAPAHSDHPIWPGLRWFSFLYWGADGMSEDAMRQQIDRMRFTRKENKLILSLTHFFNLPEDHTERLLLTLQWHEQALMPAGFLEFYLRVLALSLPFGEPVANLTQLMSGLTDLPPFQTPHEDLMALPPANRGESLKIAKIYWYLGLCRDSNDVSKILAKAETFKNQLQSGRPKPVY